MSFWNLSDNSNAADTGGEFEAGGGNMEPIPAGTTVLAAMEESKWDDYEGTQYISNTWTVLAPEEYKNRKVFQKLYVMGDDRAKDPAKKADKAKRMLAAIDTNAGGKLLASGEMPTDDMLTRHLVNKPMMLRLEIWEMEVEGQTKSGNWVSAVAPRGNGAAAPKAAPAQTPAKPPVEDYDDDVGF
jgi:hypothetical protein